MLLKILVWWRCRVGIYSTGREVELCEETYMKVWMALSLDCLSAIDWIASLVVPIPKTGGETKGGRQVEYRSHFNFSIKWWFHPLWEPGDTAQATHVEKKVF